MTYGNPFYSNPSFLFRHKMPIGVCETYRHRKMIVRRRKAASTKAGRKWRAGK